VRCPVADNRYRRRACAIEPDGGPDVLCVTRGRISGRCTCCRSNFHSDTFHSDTFHSDIARSRIGAAPVGLGRYIGCRGHGRAEISR